MESDPTVLYHLGHQTMRSPGPGDISIELGSFWNQTLEDKHSVPYCCVGTVIMDSQYVESQNVKWEWGMGMESLSGMGMTWYVKENGLEWNVHVCVIDS